MRIHERIAEGIRIIGNKINPLETIMPIGLDGAVLCHLLNHYYEKSAFHYPDQLENIVCASSKAGESDMQKFEGVLPAKGTVYGLDLRTKTGALGNNLKQMVKGWETKTQNKADFWYTVLFDPVMCADLRAFSEQLSDEDRIVWLPEEDFEKVFQQEGGIWRYNISHEFLAHIPDVQEIKDLL